MLKILTTAPREFIIRFIANRKLIIIIIHSMQYLYVHVSVCIWMYYVLYIGISKMLQTKLIFIAVSFPSPH